MMRLIDADELLELYADAPDIKFDMMVVPIPVVRQNIKDMPIIDAVPVVRCRECIWYTKRMCYHPRFEYVCEIPPTMFDFDYCRYGERKEGTE